MSASSRHELLAFLGIVDKTQRRFAVDVGCHLRVGAVGPRVARVGAQRSVSPVHLPVMVQGVMEGEGQSAGPKETGTLHQPLPPPRRTGRCPRAGAQEYWRPHHLRTHRGRGSSWCCHMRRDRSRPRTTSQTPVRLVRRCYRTGWYGGTWTTWLVLLYFGKIWRFGGNFDATVRPLYDRADGLPWCLRVAISDRRYCKGQFIMGGVWEQSEGAFGQREQRGRSHHCRTLLMQ